MYLLIGVDWVGFQSLTSNIYGSIFPLVQCGYTLYRKLSSTKLNIIIMFKLVEFDNNVQACRISIIMFNLVEFDFLYEDSTRGNMSISL